MIALPTFRFDSLDHLERSAACWGASVMDKADELLEAYSNDERPHERAALSARAWALYLAGVLPNAHGHTKDERAGMKLQAAWWHEIAEEIREREGA